VPAAAESVTAPAPPPRVTETPPSSSKHHLGQTTYTGLFVAGLELDLAPY
jgi:hypothetical protein